MGKKTNIEFVQEIHSLVGEEYTFLDEYINSLTKLQVRHNTCGNVYYKEPKSFLKGNRCRKCAHKLKSMKQTKTQEEFENEVKNLTEGNYTVEGAYVNSATKVKVKHHICGRESEVRPDSFIGGSRCISCAHESYSELYTKTTAKYNQEVKEITRNTYEVVGEYTGVNKKVNIQHLTCGTTYRVTPHQFNRGRRCPQCNLSKGEQIVGDVLTDLGVEYEQQKTFEDLGRLSYDFYIPNKRTLVEYQGVQHYEPVELFGGEEQLVVQKCNDKKKREYAHRGSYNLIEIPYVAITYEEIEKYLKVCVN